MRKISLLLLVFTLLNVSCSQLNSLSKKRHSVNQKLEELENYPLFKTAGFGFYAVDLNTGEIISEHQPDMALKPASTQKLLTTATILNLMGPDFRFKTSLAYSGKIDIQTNYLDGSIYLIGGGDPTLGSKYFESTNGKQFLEEFANAIHKLGIDSISGSIIADATYFSWDMVPPTWSWQNMGQYYGAAANGLTLFDNYFSILFNTFNYGDTSEIIGTQPLIPELFFSNEVIADSISYDNAYVFGAPYSNRRIVKGELPLMQKNFVVRAALPDPAYLAALQIDSALRSKTIKIKERPSTIRRLLEKSNTYFKPEITIFYTKESVTLEEIVEQTNIHSINLFAEHCLLQVGVEMGAQKNAESSADSMMVWWESHGMDIQGLSVNDGSGLSQYNAITPRQMVFLLSYMKNKSEYFDEFYNSMPIAGRTGTIKNMFKGSLAEGNLRAKSGTITRAKAYAGYVTSASGREIAFSMVVNNFSCRSSEARKKLEELMIALSELEK